MKFDFNVTIPKSDAEDINGLYKFYEEMGNNKNMCITYESKKEAASRYSVLKRKIANEQMSLEISRIDNKVYVKRVTDAE